jgi:hypothetical protein
MREMPIGEVARLSTHIAELTRDVESAKQLYAPHALWSAESVGYFIRNTQNADRHVHLGGYPPAERSGVKPV